MKLINSWNQGNKVAVRYEDSDESRRLKVFDFDWYFAILKNDKQKANTILKKEGFLYTIKDDDQFPKYSKIYTQNYYDLNQNKYSLVTCLESSGIKTFEGDLASDRRWYIDTQPEISQKYSKLYFDIEVDDTTEKIEIGRDRIISFSAIDNTGNEFFYCLESLTDVEEKKLLKHIISLIEKYDILLGWNSSQFDIPYIKSRMKYHQFDKKYFYKWKEIASFDLLKRFRHIFRFDSYIRKFNLDFISNYFLGHGKIQIKSKVVDLWSSDRNKLKEYNIEDSKLVRELDEKLKVSEMMIRQSSWCGVPVSQFGLYRIIDAHILRTAHKMGEFGPTSLNSIKERQKDNSIIHENPDESTTKKNKYLGAAVLDPKPGLYKNVYTFDFKGLYPSLIRTSNIGLDTIRYATDGDLIVNPGTNEIPRIDKNIKLTFFLKSPSIISTAITELIEKRKEYKDLKLKMIEEGRDSGSEWQSIVSDEIIVKELSNSTYGIMGLEYGRYYSIDVAESITLFGQWVLRFTKKFFEQEKYNVIYGDTDSIFICADDTFDTIKILKKFHEILIDTLKSKYNIDTSFIQLNFDRYYEIFILIAKKTYVGRVKNIEGKKTDSIYARGLDYLKRNTFTFAKKKQQEFIKFIFGNKPTNEEIKEWYYKTRELFYSTNFTKEDLIVIQRIGRDFNTYKSIPLHVQLGQKRKERTGQYLRGVEIEYIVTSMLQGKLTGCLEDEWDGKTFSPDYYWYHKTKPLFERITKVVFPDLDFEDSFFTEFQKLKNRQMKLFN